MSLQDDCNACHQRIFDAYEEFLQAHRDAYAEADAAGASLNTKIAWDVAFDTAKSAMQAVCTKAKNCANSVGGVTVQSSPGPKNNSPIN